MIKLTFSHKIYLNALWVFGAVILLLTCNAFNPLSNKPRGVDAKLMEAKLHMQEGEFDKALPLLDAVIDNDPNKSEAYYLRGKAKLRKNGIDIIYIWQQINPETPNSVPFLYQVGAEVKDENGNVSVNKELHLPATLENGVVATVLDSVFEKIAKLHTTCKEAFLDLQEIEKRTKAKTSDMVIQPSMYRLDYSIESFLVISLELLADFEKNGKVSSEEDKNMYKLWCSPEYADFTNIDNIEIDSIKALASNPNKINQAIDSTLARLDSITMPSIYALDDEIADANKGITTGDTIPGNTTSKFKEFAGNIQQHIRIYRYNDRADNDTDHVDLEGAPGSPDPMIWIDYDHDGLIDVDSTPSGWFTLKDVTPGQQIGDSAHYWQNPLYYQGVEIDPLTLQPMYYTHTPEDGPWSVRVIKFKKYLGPRQGEWIAGEWGVDEEKMDGKDNDRDGTIDEDTRIVEDTTDDDGDWADPVIRKYKLDGNHGYPPSDSNMLKPQIMVWKDTLVVDGRVTSIEQNPETGLWDTLTIGTVEDSIRHPAWYVRENGKLIYLGIPRGEFISGDWGLDEELFDGLDNDADGFVDEDVSARLPHFKYPVNP